MQITKQFGSPFSVHLLNKKPHPTDWNGVLYGKNIISFYHAPGYPLILVNW